MNKVLVANRGEIALRVMRACREEGLQSVAVYTSQEDRAPHVRYADEAVCIASDETLPYLDIGAILQAATETRADAIHPGYGFLAENARFAQACAEAGFVFVGPPATAIAIMGDKVKARAAAERAGVPITPGSDGSVDAAAARNFGEAAGYPIALKAVAGGGGRGFRVVHSSDDVEAAWESASGEAQRYFSDPTLYCEKYIDRPRHIEIQLMADTHGNVVGIGERDCSIQRRHQKLIEEAPSPVLSPDIRAAMNLTAEELARAVNYVGAGTVEFLYSAGEFYFLEMNTRIQVEHPITEEITGLDLVREQLRVAGGQRLSFSKAPELQGHAIECRINAEDPARDFTPVPGLIRTFAPPSGFGVRVDTGFETGSEIDPRFDNLIAKLIVRGRDRTEALSRMERALRDIVVEGVPTTVPLFQCLLRRPDFQVGDYDTGYLERIGVAETLPPFNVPAEPDDDELIAVEVNGRTYSVRLPEELGRSSAGTRGPARRRKARDGHSTSSAPAGNELTSPIQGTVLSVRVAVGDAVEPGQIVCVVEAMKMENELTAHRVGVVVAIQVAQGDTVKAGQVVAEIADPNAEAG